LLTENGECVWNTSILYFSTVHKWLPIVSKKRIDLGFSLQDSGSDVAALFLAMRLLAAPLEKREHNPDVYLTTKRFLATLERNGLISFVCLQAMVLVAAYEYAHAIYPAAWMTVGACSRYAEVLGLSLGKKTFSMLGPAVSHPCIGRYIVANPLRKACMGQSRRVSKNCLGHLHSGSGHITGQQAGFLLP
jgi:hypothetical protein